MDGNDPRVFFAAERTLLAWVRTGLAVIGLGFVVARFGLFLRMLRRQSAEVLPHPASTAIGVGFVLLGSAAVALAAWNHVSFVRTLQPQERPPGYHRRWAVVFAAVLGFAGLILAAYLLTGLAGAVVTEIP